MLLVVTGLWYMYQGGVHKGDKLSGHKRICSCKTSYLQNVMRLSNFVKPMIPENTVNVALFLDIFIFRYIYSQCGYTKIFDSVNLIHIIDKLLCLPGLAF